MCRAHIGDPEWTGFSPIVTEAALAGFTRKSAIRYPVRGHLPEVPPLARRMRPLEAHPVDLVTGRFRREPAVRVFWGGAMVDDAVDFAGNRHGNAVRIGELHDDADSVDALGDLVHRCDDLVDRLACAELLADMAVAAALAGARDDEIAHAGQPGEGVAVTARRLAELGPLAHRAGHHHGTRVFSDTK